MTHVNVFMQDLNLKMGSDRQLWLHAQSLDLIGPCDSVCEWWSDSAQVAIEMFQALCTVNPISNGC